MVWSLLLLFHFYMAHSPSWNSLAWTVSAVQHSSSTSVTVWLAMLGQLLRLRPYEVVLAKRSVLLRLRKNNHG